MNYKRIYDEFIKDRREKENALTGYTERHHILPRCMGGQDGAENLIRLTPEDHLFSHVLLARAYGGQLWYALTLMLRPAKRLGVNRGKRCRWIAALAKREQARRQTGIKRPDVSAALKGRPKSQSHRARLSESRKGRTDSEATKAKKSAALKLRVHTPERNAKVSAGLKGRNFSAEHRSKIYQPARSFVTSGLATQGMTAKSAILFMMTGALSG